MLNAISLYVIMSSGGASSEVLISRKTALYSLIVIVALTFSLAVVLTAILAYKKLSKLKWLVGEITAMRGKLMAEVKGLKKLLDARKYGLEIIFDGEEAIMVSSGLTRLTEISDSLIPESENYEKDHITFLTVICIVCVLYLVALVMWLFVLHAGNCYCHFFYEFSRYSFEYLLHFFFLFLIG